MKHPSRKKIRLAPHHYDGGTYFVTINVKDYKKVLSEVVGGKVVVNELGSIVQKYRECINDVYEGVYASDLVVMPNHIHGIVVIEKHSQCVRVIDDLSSQGVRAISNRPYDDPLGSHSQSSVQDPSMKSRYGMLSKVLKSWKQICTKKIRKQYNSDFGWHRSFYDRIIRNEQQYELIQKYIENNPLQWEIDGK